MNQQPKLTKYNYQDIDPKYKMPSVAEVNSRVIEWKPILEGAEWEGMVYKNGRWVEK